MSALVIGPSGGKRYLLWITSVRDGHDHAVYDDELDAGAVSGHYRAICEHDVVPAAMSAPPGPRCLVCLMRCDRIAQSARRGSAWRAIQASRRLRSLIRNARGAE